MHKVDIQTSSKCPHSRVYTEVSTFQVIGIKGLYRGVLISGGWNRGIPLYKEMSSFQGVGIEE